jgi:drug/metabolite transporter (DMT)-like permease
MSRLRSPHLGMMLAVLFWGGNFTASKIAFTEISPLAFTAIRFTIGTVILWALMRRLEPEGTTPPALWGRMIWLGIVGNTVYQVCFVLGLARTSATNTSLLLAAMPTVVTVTAGVLGLETITRRQVIALVLATIGVLVVVGRNGFHTGGDWLGDGLILSAVACWTIYTIGTRRLGTQLTALRFTTLTMITGTPGLLILGLPDLVRLPWLQISWQAWAGLGYSLMLSLVASYVLWNRGVQLLGASRAALYNCITPLVAAALATVILHEQLTWVHFVGGGLILGGVVLGMLRRPAPIASGN